MKTISQQFKTITSYQGYDFKKWFGDMPYKKETTKLFSKKLPRSMNDEEILRELKPTEVSLGEVFNYLKNEKDHSVRCLFYVKDNAGVLRAVYVRWFVGGWDVSAFSVEDPIRWGGGRQMFSRNFETETLEHSEPLTLCPHCNKEIGVKIIKK
jgi:hypothetical protein